MLYVTYDAVFPILILIIFKVQINDPILSHFMVILNLSPFIFSFNQKLESPTALPFQ